MSKLVTSSYEYACYDDAAGTLAPTQGTPPNYPPALDTYRAGNVATAPLAYGTQVINSTGSTTTLVTMPGATLTLIADPSNTSLVRVAQAATTPVPGGVSQPLYFHVGPNQTITLPGPINSGQLTVSPVTPAYTAVTVPFVLTVLWVA